MTHLPTLTMVTVYFCTSVECDHASMSSLPVWLPLYTQCDINKSAQLRCSLSTQYQEVTIALHIYGWHWSMWAPSCLGFVSRCLVTFHITVLVLRMLRQLLQWLTVHSFCCTNFKPLFHKMNPQKLLPGVVMLGHGSGDSEVEDGQSIHHPRSFCLWWH